MPPFRWFCCRSPRAGFPAAHQQLHLINALPFLVLSLGIVRLSVCPCAFCLPAGMTFSNLGVLYFGDLNGDRVVQTDLSVTPALQSTLASNYTTMQWQDTFGWADAPEQLVFTTNRLQLFIAGTLDITGASGANMRLFVASVPGQANYMADMAPYSPFPGPPPGPPGGGAGGYKAAHAAAVTMGVLFAFAAAAAGGMGLVLYRRRAAAARSASANADPGYAHL